MLFQEKLNNRYRTISSFKPTVAIVLIVFGFAIIALKFREVSVTPCSVLDKRLYVGSKHFQPRDCQLRRYTTPLVAECLSILSDQNSVTKKKRHWHISFMGDSRMRQMYHMINRFLPTADVEFSGHMHAINYGMDAHVNSSLLGVTISHKWRPYPDNKMEEDLRKWIKKKDEAPDVLVTGQMLWTMRNIPDHPYESYSKNMTKMINLLKQLNSTTRVIWWEQEYMKEKEFHQFFDVFQNRNIDTRRIKKYNKFVRESLEGSDVLVWDSTHPIFAEFERACYWFRFREDRHWFWRCPKDVFHAGFLYVDLYIQQLLNFLCNPVMKDKRYCCSAI